MIKDLTVDNYRLFRHFKLDSIARVNLIVGTNNSGKSSLLETIHLLTSNDLRLSLVFILSERGEFVSGTLDPRFNRGKTGGYQVAQIFYNRSLKPGQIATIHSTASKDTTLRIALRTKLRDNEGVEQPFLVDEKDAEGMADDLAELLVFERNGRESAKRLPITEDGLLIYDRLYAQRIPHPKGNSKLVTTNYLGYDELAVLWDKITLTPREGKVIEALQLLEPKVKRINFTTSRSILLLLREENEPIPLGSMGDGMRRILAIIASLVSVEEGTLLVDEIGAGLYYGVLVDMWRLILETSLKQGAQVFATTHSWDCVKAYQQALDSFDNSDIGCLIRLERVDDEIKAGTYSANELDIAINQGIEVR